LFNNIAANKAAAAGDYNHNTNSPLIFYKYPYSAGL
jgi:hypothetical protein